jgi:DNA helicase-2/ATP-dependent DNA helicase PcrA
MIDSVDFYRAYETFRPRPDDDQQRAINAGPTDALFIVAGPGSGKTTCLTLRVLKLILVDDVPPRSILATTFTKKAAAELRSRILGWGFRLVETLQNDSGLSQETRARVGRVDINQVVTGTIDSICEEVLRRYRDPGTMPPVLADDFVAKTLMLREGLFASRRDLDTELDRFLLALKGGSTWGWNVGAKNSLLLEIWDRRYQDQVDWGAFVGGAPPSEAGVRTTLDQALLAYAEGLAERGMVDFALLEQEVLKRLRAGQLAELMEEIQVVLVDEYQDTNLLQEQIYFAMARASNGALNVVGDDDQSLYRFRGATVELFSEFSRRYQEAFGRAPVPVFLRTNYRSTQRIVNLVNGYAQLDGVYQQVRVQDKPTIEYAPGATLGVPVLGMFRDDVATLAADLASLIQEVFRGNGYAVPGRLIQRQPNGGDLGDCALLASSPAEYNASGKERLPLFLRGALRRGGIAVFNPRGQDLTAIEVMARFGGLLLECLDPGGVIESQTNGLSNSTLTTFRTWRNMAIDYASSNTRPGLVDFAVGWAERNPRRAGWQWPLRVPVLELVYGLLYYFPELYDDPEGQIYLEVFTRQISACEQVGKFSGRVVTDPTNKGLSDKSVAELLRDFLGPIAAGAVDVNEELMEAFPRDRLSVLSIHQAKGLEFPLTIVDVGSDFKTNAPAHRFKRYPKDGSTPQAMEDLLRPYTALQAPTRSAVDRAFDDLYRQFFVAFSRPQDVLLLVGLRSSSAQGYVPNIATGWERTGICRWAGANVPYIEI